MTVDDPIAAAILQRSMVARIASLAPDARPSVTPLYFVAVRGHIWLGTVDWTIAVRNLRLDPRVSVLFEVERDRGERPVLRIAGHASIRRDPETWHSYVLRVARKYVLTPGGIGNVMAHFRQRPMRRAYAAQSAAKGSSCVIDVTPEQVENTDRRRPAP